MYGKRLNIIPHFNICGIKVTLEEFFQDNFIRREFKEYRTLPYLITWGIWLVRNAKLLRMSKLPFSKFHYKFYHYFLLITVV